MAQCNKSAHGNLEHVMNMISHGASHFGYVKLVTAILALVAATVPAAEALANEGEKIASRFDNSDNGFGSSVVDLTMTLISAKGKKSVRKLEIRTLERKSANVGDKSLISFSVPRDVKGTALLSYSNIAESDDQWLYLPSIQRVKRIASGNKSGPFLGSEFAYEDFTGLESGKFTFRYLRSSKLGSTPVHVIEAKPKYANSGYSKQEWFLDKATSQVRRVRYYNRRGALSKTLTLGNFVKYKGRFWRPHSLHMKNHLTKRATSLSFGQYRMQAGLSASQFTQSALRRAR